MRADLGVVVAGGGPAGLTAALALVRAAPGLADRVCVIERETYPRVKPCAGGLGERGAKILRALGAEPEVPAVRIDGLAFTARCGHAVSRPGAIGRVVRRLEFDAALADAVRAAGVRIYEATTVKGIAAQAGGVRVETSRGALRALAVIGADGVGSRVRRALGLPRGRLRAQVLEVDSVPAADDPPRDVLHFDLRDASFPGYAWDFPTLVDGRPLVCRGVYWLRIGDSRVDVRARLAEHLARRGLDLADAQETYFAERGFEPAGRVSDGRRLLLVGEAAGVDPVSGEGIAQAIEGGALAGRFLAGRLGASRPAAGWQLRFRRARLARDLAGRRALVMGYGALRPALERALVGDPEVVAILGRHFAGRRWGRRRTAAVLARALPRILAGP